MLRDETIFWRIRNLMRLWRNEISVISFIVLGTSYFKPMKKLLMLFWYALWFHYPIFWMYQLNEWTAMLKLEIRKRGLFPLKFYQSSRLFGGRTIHCFQSSLRYTCCEKTATAKQSRLQNIWDAVSVRSRRNEINSKTEWIPWITNAFR